MLTATTARAAKYEACPGCDGVLIRLKLDPRRDRELIALGAFELSRPTYECPACGAIGQDSVPSPVGRELVILS